MKTPDHKFRKVLLILGINILISWLLGNILKDPLIKHLSVQIYYQLIIFISLIVAPSVNLTYTYFVNLSLKNKEKKLKDKLVPEVIEKLKEDEKQYAESLINPNIEAAEQLRRLKAERDAFESSR